MSILPSRRSDLLSCRSEFALIAVIGLNPSLKKMSLLSARNKEIIDLCSDIHKEQAQYHAGEAYMEWNAIVAIDFLSSCLFSYSLAEWSHAYRASLALQMQMHTTHRSHC